MSSAPNLKLSPVAQAVGACLKYWNKPDSLKRYLLIYNNLKEQRNA